MLELRQAPRPIPAAHEVLVRVRATALNRADLLQRQGRYPAPPGAPAQIGGLEFAGEVAELGAASTLWRGGDRVFGITGGGAHAEYLIAHERTLARVPERLGWAEAAAVPEAFMTAYDALVTQAAVRPGERVLVHAVGSGVGLAAVQLARAVGAVVYGDSRTADKVDRAREFGLEDGVVVVAGDVEIVSREAMRWSGDAGMDVVLDLAGGAYTVASINAAATLGRIILIGTMAGASATLPLGLILRKRLSIRGTVLRSRPIEEKIAVARAFAAHVVPLLAQGVLRPVVDRRFTLSDIRAAHQHLESNATFGKVVLTVGDGG